MRMQQMRKQVMEHNIYRWAAMVLGDLRDVRLELYDSEDGGSLPEPIPTSTPHPVKWHRRRGSLIQSEAEKLNHFFSSLRTAETPLLLLDYDGTLADFRIDRFTARPWAGVRELLTKIQNDGRTQLRVITGRPAGEINPLLQLSSPCRGLGPAWRRTTVCRWAPRVAGSSA